jgi:hypothetical protein
LLLILPISILAAVVGCNPKQETKQVTFEHPALRKGKMRAWPDDDVLIFEKEDAEESFLIIVNVRNEPKAVQIPESWVGQETEDEVTDKDFKLESTLTLEPFQYLILE